MENRRVRSGPSRARRLATLLLALSVLLPRIAIANDQLGGCCRRRHRGAAPDQGRLPRQPAGPLLPEHIEGQAAALPTWLHGCGLTGHSGYTPRWAEFWRFD
jgi:hypothetical protein